MGKLDWTILMGVFIVSAVLGDAVNYAVGESEILSTGTQCLPRLHLTGMKT